MADIFRRAKEAKGGAPEEARPALCPGPSGSRCRAHSEPLALCGETAPRDSPPASEAPASEPGYVNYTKLYYVLESGEGTEPEDGERGAGMWQGLGWRGQPRRGPWPPSTPRPLPASPEFEDDKISLPFVVTDLRGRNLRPMRERTAVQVGVGSGRAKDSPGELPGGSWHRPLRLPTHPQGQYLTVEQLTLDFEYVINEVIRHDATWGHQFCSFSDYDIVILEVGPGRAGWAQGFLYSGVALNSWHRPPPPPGLPRNQPGPHQHWPAAPGLPVPH